MAGVMKVSLFLGCNGLGWEEIYYRPYASDDYSDAEAAASALVSARRFLSPTSVTFDYLRLSDDAIRGDSKLVGLGGGRGLFASGNAEFDHSAPGFVALLLRLESGTLYRRPLELRGLPAHFVRDTYSRAQIAAQPAGGDWLGRFDAFVSQLTGGTVKWSIKAQTKAPANVELHILSVAIDAPNKRYTLTTAEAIPDGWEGQTVRVLRMTKFPGLPGKHRVVSVGAKQVIVQVDATPALVDTKIRGLIQREVFALQPISAVIPRRWSHRDTGRPFPQGVGHR
jgi:hypothetical protein